MTESRETFDKIQQEAAAPDFAALVSRKEAKARRARVSATVVGLGITGLLIIGVFVFLRDPERAVQPGAAGTDMAIATPTNGDLLYAKYVGSTGWSLFRLDPATGKETQITDGYRDYGSDWSPDGTKIVYDSETKGGGDGIIVANADGSHPVQLTTDGGSVPAWSTDGSKIAFARYVPGEMVSIDGGAMSAIHLYVMNADGSSVHEVTHGGVGDYSPVWSPDGSQLLFHREAGEETGWLITDADGSGKARRLIDDVEYFGAPDWSPDGASLTFAATGEGKGNQGGIMILPADGVGEPVMVPRTNAGPFGVSWPAWSPDGQWIAYVEGYGTGKIVIVRPDGTDKRVLNVAPGTDSLEELAWGVA